MANAKLEARIRIPTGGWTASVTDPGGTNATAINLSAGNTYYHGSVGDDTYDFPAKLEDMLDNAATLTGEYTVSISSTGKYTISCNQTFSITFTSGDLRLLLGWDGNISSVTSSTADNQAKALWLPGVPADGDASVLDGFDDHDYRLFVSRDGTPSGLGFNRRSRHHLIFPSVAAGSGLVFKDLIGNSTNQTWNEFYRDSILGEASWSGPGPGGPIRFHYDETDDTVYSQWRVDPQTGNRFRREQQEWFAGLYTIEIDCFGSSES